MSISFKSPSENSPITPPILSFLSWVITNLFIFFGLSPSSFSGMIGQSIATTAILLIFGIFNIIILIAFLYRKKFIDFFISLVLIVILTFATGFIDKKLAPYKVKSLFGSMAKVAEQAGSSRYFGGSPVNVCEGQKDENGSYNCKACYCPYAMDLVEVDGIPHCLFRANDGQHTDDKFRAACSETRSFDKYVSEVVDLFGSDATKTFVLYKYQDNQIQSCNEFRVWNTWDISVMKKVCEYKTVFKCVVQDQKSCSMLNAKKVCQKKNKNTHQALKMVGYTGSNNLSGFEDDECQSVNEVVSAPVTTAVEKIAITGSKDLSGKTIFNVKKSIADNLSKGIADVRAAPNREQNGEIKGYKIFDVGPDSFLYNAGVIKDDVLLTINNDKAIYNMQTLMDALNTIKEHPKGFLRIQRQDKEIELNYIIEP